MTDRKLVDLISSTAKIMQGETVLSMFEKADVDTNTPLTAEDVLRNLAGENTPEFAGELVKNLRDFRCSAMVSPTEGGSYGLDDIKKFQLSDVTQNPTYKLMARGMGIEDKEVQTAAAIFFLVDWAASLDTDTFEKLPVSAVLKLEDLHDVVDKYRKDDVAWNKVSSYLSGDSGEKIAEILRPSPKLSNPEPTDEEARNLEPTDEKAKRSAFKMAKNLEAYRKSLTDEAREAYVKARNPEPTDEEATRCLEALVDSQVYVKWQELVDSNPEGIQKWGQTIRDAIGDVTLLQNLASLVPVLGDAGNNLADKGQEWLKSTVQSYGYNWEQEVTNKGPHSVEEGGGILRIKNGKQPVLGFFLMLMHAKTAQWVAWQQLE